MKNLTKLGIAGSLALGSVGAHASIALPTSYNGYLGNVVLFADIFNGTTLVAAYAGDTGAPVSTVGAGTLPTNTTFEDANLSSFLSQATSGTTVLWAVEGGNIDPNGNPFIVSSAPKVGQLQNATNGSVVQSMGVALTSQIPTINGVINGSGTSLLTTVDAANGGTGFNPLALAADLSNWGGTVADVASTGLGTTATLYTLAAAGINTSNQATTTAEMTVSLTSNGLVFSALGGGSTVTPLPAAVWLLGSGLLGLAGVGRRKSKAG